MRLLNTKTLQLENFIDQGSTNTLVHKEGDDVADYAIPQYAILSHTWGEEEVTFEDMQGDQEAAKKKRGYKKLEDSCKRAAKDGFAYIWIDTCCIDKSSSAELSEAINTMFRWYKHSAICYVFLEDCEGPEPYRINPGNGTAPRWYKRGWTLQELIAPRIIHFYSQTWKYLGTKSQYLFEIAYTTRIDLYALNGGDLSRVSIARRMNWIADRKTTRLEDMAYCMLGIFDISMPLLYGEGSKAFIRLQEEIMKGTDDQSLFAWKEDDSMDYYREDYGDAWERNGLLATSPSFFKSSTSIARFYRPRPERPQSVVTSQGLTVNFLMCRDASYQSGEVFLAILDCQINRTPGVLAGIRLRRVSAVGDEFVRIDIPQVLHFGRCNKDGTIDLEGFDPTKEQGELMELQMRAIHKDWKPKTIRVSQSPLPPLPPGFWLVPPIDDPDAVEVMRAHPRQLWDSESWIMQPDKSTFFTSKIGALQFQFGEKEFQYFLIFGLAATQEGMKPWCTLEQRKGAITLEQYFNYFRVDMGPAGEDTDEIKQQPGPYWGASHWDTILPLGIGVQLRETKVSGIDMFIMQIALS